MNIKYLQLWIATITVGCLFAVSASAQSKTATKEGPNGGSVTAERTKDVETGIVTTTRSGVSASGKTASSVRVRDTGSVSGQRSTSVTQTGPNGGTRSGSQSWTNNGDGTRTRQRTATTVNSKSASSTLTRGNGQSTKTINGPNGGSKTVTRRRRN